MYAGIVAVRHASASSLGPYTFLRLVIATVAGIALFHEIPGLLSWLGVAAILASCLLAMEAASPRTAENRALKAAP
jgi:drug/metabolite transporter (DMT)-like permease